MELSFDVVISRHSDVILSESRGTSRAKQCVDLNLSATIATGQFNKGRHVFLQCSFMDKQDR